MLFILRQIVKAAIFPPGCLLLLFALAFGIRKKHPVAAKRLAVGTFLVLYMLCTPLLSYGLSRLAESAPPVTAHMIQQFDPQAIVILGGSSNLHAPDYEFRPFPDPSTLSRVALGARWAKQTGLPILVTGGLACSHGHSEADSMAVSLGVYGLNPKWLEKKSKTTYENAVLSAPLLRADGVERILLVTSATHVDRGAKEFEALGLKVLPAPTDFAEKSFGPLYIYALLPKERAFLESCLALKALFASVKQKFI